MTDFLETTIDKFVFRAASDRRYADTEVWAKQEGDRVRVGATDFFQQRSGDVAFVNIRPVGTALSVGDELAAVETIKVDTVVPAPLAGTLLAVNEALAEHPEWVNSDPYGEGWIAEIRARDVTDLDQLLEAEAYLPRMAQRAELERGK